LERLDGLILQVQAGPNENDDELAAWTRRLRTRLLDLDVDSVDPVPESADPAGAKGLIAVIGWLAVRFGTAGVLQQVVEAVGEWASRTGRSVKVSYNGDELEICRATPAQQERIISDFLARQPPIPDPPAGPAEQPG
jgi:hypothetical protein